MKRHAEEGIFFLPKKKQKDLFPGFSEWPFPSTRAVPQALPNEEKFFFFKKEPFFFLRHTLRQPGWLGSSHLRPPGPRPQSAITAGSFMSRLTPS